MRASPTDNNAAYDDSDPEKRTLIFDWILTTATDNNEVRADSDVPDVQVIYLQILTVHKACCIDRIERQKIARSYRGMQ